MSEPPRRYIGGDDLPVRPDDWDDDRQDTDLDLGPETWPDVEWSTDQTFAGEFGQTNQFGDSID